MAASAYAALNSNSAAYYVAKARANHPFRCYYTSLGYAEVDSNKAWQRMLDLKTLHFVTVDPDARKLPDDPFNRTSEQILTRISQSDQFTLQTPARIPGILVFRSK